MTKLLTGLAASTMTAGMAFAAPDKGTSPKPPAPPSPVSTPETPVGETFSFDDVSMPEKAIGRSSGPRELTLTRKKLAAVPVGKSWLEEVDEASVPATITDPAERAKAFKEAAKKVQNRIQGDIRRHKKAAGNEAHSFSVLYVDDAERGRGVRVYRNADKTTDTPTPAAA